MAAATNQSKPPSGTAIASDALKYQGAGYVFGGVPGRGRGQWDCSSFVNWVVGHDLRMAIPGYAAGGYQGQVHGPAVVAWASWKGATTLPKGQAPQAGDLCVWNGIGASGHIGIALSATHMVSALDTKEGTVQTPIKGYGPVGAPFSYRRINGTGPGIQTTSVTGDLGGGLGGIFGGVAKVVGSTVLGIPLGNVERTALGDFYGSLIIGAGIPVVIIGVILGGAALLGLGGAFLVGAAMRRAAGG